MKPYCQAQYNNIIGRLTSNNGYFTTEIKTYSAMCNCVSWEVQTGLGMVSFWSLDINLSYFGGFSLGCIFVRGWI